MLPGGAAPGQTPLESMDVSGATESKATLWKTVLVEGQALFRELLAKALEADGRFQVVAQLEDPAEARQACRQTWPDLLIAEVDLPRAGGLALVEEVVRHLPGTRVLVLSSLREAWMLNRLCQIGIHGFVEKEQSLEILQEAALEVASGSTYFTAYIRRIQEQMDGQPKGRSQRLSTTEQKVLHLLTTGLTSRAIAEQLHLSPRSVETYRYRMMRKLGVARTAGLIKFALSGAANAPDKEASQVLECAASGAPQA
jgi:DNA-binding NarL/FixJ family response regulator